MVMDEETRATVRVRVGRKADSEPASGRVHVKAHDGEADGAFQRVLHNQRDFDRFQAEEDGGRCLGLSQLRASTHSHTL